MDSRHKLFAYKDPYDMEISRSLFLDAVRENVRLHREKCPPYAAILRNRGFDPDCLKAEGDLHKIPVIPTLYLKRNRLFSVPESALRVTATSSGTSGQKSVVGFDADSMLCGIAMMIRFLSHHRLISPLPTNYIVLGYKIGAYAQMGAAKTAYGMTFFAPPLHREYAIRHDGARHGLNIPGVEAALTRYARMGLPVRFVGFPSHMHALACSLKAKGMALRLSRRSKVLLGGGWKQSAEPDAGFESLYALISETLGIGRGNCFEFFSAAEHPLPYLKCINGRFHVPIYSRVVIRDVRTLDPLPYGSPGLLSFVSPLVTSMPLTSVVTDDLAVLHGDCGCGISTPCFELLGRAGAAQIVTCAQDAAALTGISDA